MRIRQHEGREDAASLTNATKSQNILDQTVLGLREGERVNKERMREVKSGSMKDESHRVILEFKR